MRAFPLPPTHLCAHQSMHTCICTCPCKEWQAVTNEHVRMPMYLQGLPHDQASDIFSLAMTFIELITGQDPKYDNSASGVLLSLKHLQSCSRFQVMDFNSRLMLFNTWPALLCSLSFASQAKIA